MLEIKDLSLHYEDKCVLQHFSCHIKRGEMVCLTGQSGCGKTSFLKGLIGFTPHNGLIRIAGEKLSPRTCEGIRARTAYLPQELSFPAEYVQEAVDMITTLRRDINESRKRELLTSGMQQLGLEPELLNRRMAEVSGGQRQRIMLAAIAVLNRDIWLLDEPTAALDTHSRDLVMHFLHQKQIQGATLIIVSHDTELAAQCTRLIQF